MVARLQANELISKLQEHHMTGVHVNLIPWNTVAESEFKRPHPRKVIQFRRVLELAGISVTVRAQRGSDAAAACGQLRNDFQKQALPEFAALQ